MSINDALLAYGINVIRENKTNTFLCLKGFNEEIKLSNALYHKLVSAISNNSVKSLKLPNITFGVELEFVGSKVSEDVTKFTNAMADITDGKFINMGKYAHNDGSYWILGKDSSIKYSDALLTSPTGYELSSPKLQLFNGDDIKMLHDVIDAIKTYLYGEVNNSCGTHIHLGLTMDNITKDDMSSLLLTYASMESKVFDPLVPINRRKNRYCKKTSDNLRGKYQKVSTRYCKFNHEEECKNLHVEFRQLEGNLDAQLITYWAILHSYILYDILRNTNNEEYLNKLASKNSFDILFHYDFGSLLISFFINRVVQFKSKTIQQN